MDISNLLSKGEGGYIFLSHSHYDIVKVREIRNGLEKEGFEPLCFYLKCLNDDSELTDLIKREIDAREWFVFLNSQNARASKWVTLEREYIQRTNQKKIITIDLDNNPNAVEDAINKITHSLRIFLSYSHHNLHLAQMLKTKLAEKDYRVFFDLDDLGAGDYYVKKVATAISEAAKYGFVIALLTKESMESSWCFNEIEYARRLKASILPIVVGDVELNDVYRFLLGHIQWYRLSENPTDEELDQLTDEIGNYILYYLR